MRYLRTLSVVSDVVAGPGVLALSGFCSSGTGRLDGRGDGAGVSVSAPLFLSDLFGSTQWLLENLTEVIHGCVGEYIREIHSRKEATGPEDPPGSSWSTSDVHPVGEVVAAGGCEDPSAQELRIGVLITSCCRSCAGSVVSLIPSRFLFSLVRVQSSYRGLPCWTPDEKIVYTPYALVKKKSSSRRCI